MSRLRRYWTGSKHYFSLYLQKESWEFCLCLWGNSVYQRNPPEGSSCKIWKESKNKTKQRSCVNSLEDNHSSQDLQRPDLREEEIASRWAPHSPLRCPHPFIHWSSVMGVKAKEGVVAERRADLVMGRTRSKFRETRAVRAREEVILEESALQGSRPLILPSGFAQSICPLLSCRGLWCGIQKAENSPTSQDCGSHRRGPFSHTLTENGLRKAPQLRTSKGYS